MSHKWQSLFFNQTFNNRALNANLVENSNFKIGKNLIENRFTLLNNKITFQMLNMEYDLYIIQRKELFSKIKINKK